MSELFEKFSFASPSAGLLIHKTQQSKVKGAGNETLKAKLVATGPKRRREDRSEKE